MKINELNSIKQLYERIRTEKNKVLFLTVDQILLSFSSIYYVFLFKELIDLAINKQMVFFQKTVILLVLSIMVLIILSMFIWYITKDCRSSIESIPKACFPNVLLHKKYKSISDNYFFVLQMKIKSDCVIIVDWTAVFEEKDGMIIWKSR